MRLIPGSGEGPTDEDNSRGIAEHVFALEILGLPREEAIAEVAERIAAFSLDRGVSRAVVMPRAVDRVLLALDFVERNI